MRDYVMGDYGPGPFAEKKRVIERKPIIITPVWVEKPGTGIDEQERWEWDILSEESPTIVAVKDRDGQWSLLYRAYTGDREPEFCDAIFDTLEDAMDYAESEFVNYRD